MEYLARKPHPGRAGGQGAVRAGFLRLGDGKVEALIRKKEEEDDEEACAGCAKTLWHVAGAEGKPEWPEYKDLSLFPVGNTH